MADPKIEPYAERCFHNCRAAGIKNPEKLPELVEAAKGALEYFDQRADVQEQNHHAPNEEMKLWEDLNNALAGVGVEG